MIAKVVMVEANPERSNQQPPFLAFSTAGVFCCHWFRLCLSPAAARGLIRSGSMRLFIVIVGLFAFCGCQSHTASSDPFTNMSLANDSRLSPRDREIIAAARNYLEKQNWETNDVYYKIETMKDGYEVLVVGYVHGRALSHTVGHGRVVLRKDLSFVRYVPES